jgi:hypothetical protein
MTFPKRWRRLALKSLSEPPHLPLVLRLRVEQRVNCLAKERLEMFP